MTEVAAESVSGTRARILDAAELAFAREGYDAAGFREITAAAGVNLAAAHYHFGGKEALFEEVFVRRIRPINAERLRRIDEAGGVFADVRAAVDVVLLPMRHLLVSDAAGGCHPFVRCMARTLLDPRPFMAPVLEREFRPFLDAFTRALRPVLPQVRPAELAVRIQAMLGAIVFTMARVGQPPLLGRPGHAGPDARTVIEQLRAFCAAGLAGGAP